MSGRNSTKCPEETVQSVRKKHHNVSGRNSTKCPEETVQSVRKKQYKVSGRNSTKCPEETVQSVRKKHHNVSGRNSTTCQEETAQRVRKKQYKVSGRNTTTCQKKTVQSVRKKQYKVSRRPGAKRILLHIYNQSWSTGNTVPTIWKEALIRPIPIRENTSEILPATTRSVCSVVLESFWRGSSAKGSYGILSQTQF